MNAIYVMIITQQRRFLGSNLMSFFSDVYQCLVNYNEGAKGKTNTTAAKANWLSYKRRRERKAREGIL